MKNFLSHLDYPIMIVSVAIALSIMGDSLMYGILPLEAANLGFSLPMVGLLL